MWRPRWWYAPGRPFYVLSRGVRVRRTGSLPQCGLNSNTLCWPGVPVLLCPGGSPAGRRSTGGRSTRHALVGVPRAWRLCSFFYRSGYPDTTLGRTHTNAVTPVISPVGQGPTRPRNRPRSTSKEAEGLLWVLGTRPLHVTACMVPLTSGTDQQTTQTRTLKGQAFISERPGGDHHHQQAYNDGIHSDTHCS